MGSNFVKPNPTKEVAVPSLSAVRPDGTPPSPACEHLRRTLRDALLQNLSDPRSKLVATLEKAKADGAGEIEAGAWAGRTCLTEPVIQAFDKLLLHTGGCDALWIRNEKEKKTSLPLGLDEIQSCYDAVELSHNSWDSEKYIRFSWEKTLTAPLQSAARVKAEAKTLNRFYRLNPSFPLTAHGVSAEDTHYARELQRSKDLMFLCRTAGNRSSACAALLPWMKLQ